MRTFADVPSLVAIYHLHRHVIQGEDLPQYMQARDAIGLPLDVRRILHPWLLDVLAREVVLNADSHGKRVLSSWNELATAVNKIRAIGGGIAERRPENQDIYRDIHRIIHHQFPWQKPPSTSSMMRYYKIYAGTALEPLIEAKVGLPMSQLYRLGLAATGHFMESETMSIVQDYGPLKIDNDAATNFFRRITSTLPDLKKQTQARQSYDQAWEYAWNPMYATPLIEFDPAQPDRVICPLPSLLMRRISEGIFYDIAGDEGFQNAYGSSFERYVGEVANQLCSTPPFRVWGERQYRVGNNLKHGVDWTIEDKNATLFVECKTKRLRHDAKFGADDDQLLGDLDAMAGFIVQHYKNIADALAGLTLWEPTGRPIYPLIVTLEDWWLFNHVVLRLLQERVDARFNEAGLDRTMLTEMPFTIASIDELEITLQVLGEIGIDAFMRAKTADAHREWALGPFTQYAYPAEVRRATRQLFEKDWLRLCE